MTIGYAKHHVENLAREIERIREYEFPYDHSHEALRQIEGIVNGLDNRLKAVESEPYDEVTCEAVIALVPRTLREYLPIIGFIVRSTNIRNCFEVHGPLLRLARKVINKNTKLIISSEWEFSPHIFSEIRGLKDFILVGFPAMESSHPFLLPLAGHEFGHAVWKIRELPRLLFDLPNNICAQLKLRFSELKKIIPGVSMADLEPDRISFKPWSKALLFAERQICEAFCDLYGFRMFGRSFLFSFEYLFSPCNGMARNANYPDLRQRAELLDHAAKLWGIKTPDNFLKCFGKTGLTPHLNDETTFFVSIADSMLTMYRDTLLEEADKAIKEAKLPVDQEENIRKAIEDFKKVVPSDSCETVTELMNAAWESFNDATKWETHQDLRGKEFVVLSDLVIKSFEIIDVQYLINKK